MENTNSHQDRIELLKGSTYSDDEYDTYDYDDQSDSDEDEGFEMRSEPEVLAGTCVSNMVPIIYHNHLLLEEKYRVRPETIIALQNWFKNEYRRIVINWMIQLHNDLSNSSDSIFLAIAYFDNFLMKKSIQKEQLHLVAAVCFWLATKVDSVRTLSFAILNQKSSNIFTKEQFMAMEIEIFESLDFCLSYPTPKEFLRRYMKATCASEEVYMFADFILKTSICEIELATYLPSELAYASFYTSCYALSNDEIYLNLEKMRLIDISNIKELVSMIKNVIEKPIEKLKAEGSAQTITDRLDLNRVK